MYLLVVTSERGRESAAMRVLNNYNWSQAVNNLYTKTWGDKGGKRYGRLGEVFLPGVRANAKALRQEQARGRWLDYGNQKESTIWGQKGYVR